MASWWRAPRAQRAWLTRGSVALAVLVPALLFLWGGYERRWAGDDGFINLRVVRQLVAGNGFVFNAGERSEAVTSPAWVFLLWLCAELGLDLERATWILALALGVLGMLMAGLASARVQQDEPEQGTVTLPLGLLAYAAIPAAWDYATAALENSLGLAYLGSAAFLVAQHLRTRARALAVAAFVGLGPVVRPDYALYALPFALTLLVARPTWGARARTAGMLALPGVAYQLFRMGYFAAIVPNTAIAKQAFASWWSQGWLYVANTYRTYQLWLPLAVVLLAWLAISWRLLRERAFLRAAVPASLLLGGVLHILYIARVGGDFMHARMMLPGTFAIFAAAATVRVRPRDHQLALALVGFVTVASWGIECARSFRPPPAGDQILDERRWWTDVAGRPNPLRIKHYARHPFYVSTDRVRHQIAAGCPHGLASLADDSTDRCQRVAWVIDLPQSELTDHHAGELLPLDPDAVGPNVIGVYAYRPLGVSGGLMGLRISVVDAYGLADPFASRSELPSRSRPGHEKEMTVPWMTAKYAVAGASNDPRVLAGRRALQCGLLKELFHATHDPLTVGRFLRNVWMAVPLHRVSIPMDTFAAESRFCER